MLELLESHLVPEWAVTMCFLLLDSSHPCLEAWQWQKVSAPAWSLCRYENKSFHSCPFLSHIGNPISPGTLLLLLENSYVHWGGVQKKKWDHSAWVFLMCFIKCNPAWFDGQGITRVKAEFHPGFFVSRFCETSMGPFCLSLWQRIIWVSTMWKWGAIVPDCLAS